MRGDGSKVFARGGREARLCADEDQVAGDGRVVLLERGVGVGGGDEAAGIAGLQAFGMLAASSREADDKVVWA